MEQLGVPEVAKLLGISQHRVRQLVDDDPEFPGAGQGGAPRAMGTQVLGLLRPSPQSGGSIDERRAVVWDTPPNAGP